MKPFKFFVYAQVYIIDCNVPNTEMAGSNVYMLVNLEQESESDDIAEVK